ncbi:Type 1 glutamine amidotransferase-like domain-containing protein [Candidatus Roizmanbacteria bacterium]|nr:Type 1 glutamine amidotransferase-like domain-containing protein [Candidatus Roizmanbacteria bacterium]
MSNISKSVKDLIDKRESLRKQKKFDDADKIRRQIEKLGYFVEDTKMKTNVVEKVVVPQKPKNSFIVLFGSGEIASSGRKVHEKVFGQIGKDPISIAIITTPAGFQPNVKSVHEEIAEFFKIHLANFHPKIDIIFANTWVDANNPEIIKPIENADYIFTGPGSPTYAVEHLRDTLLYRKILEKVREGITLSLSSAAVIAFSKYCLPVYEIYKVGEQLHWIKGLNFFSKFWEPLTIIPHFNNNEGGEKTDTSHCWMGKERFQKLIKILPKNEKIIGIDEHTAIIYELKRKKYNVYGLGSVYKVNSRKIATFVKDL